MENKKENDFKFESALNELEDIVKTMEQGDLSLDKSLEAFEEGVKLTRNCQQALKNAEQRILQVQATDHGIEMSDFKENPKVSGKENGND